MSGALLGLLGAGSAILLVYGDGGTAAPWHRSSRPLQPSAQVPAPAPPTAAPTPTGDLQSPGAVAVAPDGSLVIADGGRIVRRATDGTFSVVANIGARSLAVAPDGTIFAADQAGNRVAAFALGGVVTTIVTLPDASSIAHAPEGTLYVVDQDGVVGVAPDGSVRPVVRNRFVDVRGTPMAFFPFTVTVDDDGNLFVADGGVKLLGKFAPDGTLLQIWGPQVYVSPGSGLATAPDGTIVLAEWGGQIERLDGSALTTIVDGYRANGIAVGTDGTIYFTSDGESGWGPVGLWSIAADGTISRLEPR